MRGANKEQPDHRFVPIDRVGKKVIHLYAVWYKYFSQKVLNIYPEFPENHC